MNDLLKQLAALIPLAKAATAGPWEPVVSSPHVASEEVTHSVAGPPSDFMYLESGADAAFIVAARNLLTPENLLALCAALAPQWVSVTDRLPEHNGQVLICAYTDNARTPVWRQCKVAELSDDGLVWSGEWSEHDWCDAECATHWMPLPAMPATMEGAQPNA